MSYCLDANVFIERMQREYPLDLFEPVWAHVSAMLNDGRCLVLDKVMDEVNGRQDEISDGVNEHVPSSAIVDTTPLVLTTYPGVIQWATSKPQYMPKALAEFATDSIADAWLVAHALETGACVITNEISSPHSKARIKIPDCCNALSVSHMQFLPFLRESGFTL